MKKINSVIFLSNFFNHHQQPFSEAMYAELGHGFTFIETKPMTQERKSMGWGMDRVPAYVLPSQYVHSCPAECEEMVFQADVVIYGSAPYALVKRRIRANKLTYRYSERPLKKAMPLWKLAAYTLRMHQMYPQNRKVYLLCASAYAASDYAKLFMFRNRSYKWGYFPETKQYADIDSLIRNKSENSVVWVARYIELKHPEIAVEIGKRLKQAGYQFELNMIGNGPLLEEMNKMVKQEGLEDEVHVLGAMSPVEVRRYMERAQIHLFTSDRNEGWGAVLNESMNSACVPVADRNIGSTPYLIEDGVNGYACCGIDELYERVRYLLDHKKEREAMAKQAYTTIVKDWNAEVAARRLILLSESILFGNEYTMADGCCSREGN